MVIGIGFIPLQGSLLKAQLSSRRKRASTKMLFLLTKKSKPIEVTKEILFNV